MLISSPKVQNVKSSYSFFARRAESKGLPTVLTGCTELSSRARDRGGAARGAAGAAGVCPSRSRFQPQRESDRAVSGTLGEERSREEIGVGGERDDALIRTHVVLASIEQAMVEDDNESTFELGQKVLSVDVDGSARRADGLPPAPLFEAVIRDSCWKNIGQTGEILHQTPKKRKRNHLDDESDAAAADGQRELVYFVHFLGWNARFDRWVRKRDVFIDNATNRARVGRASSKFEKGKIPLEAPQLQSGGVVNAAKPKEESKPAEHHAKKSKAKPTEQQNLQLISKACELPFTLQIMLVDDKDKITRVVYPFHIEGRPKGGNTLLHVLPAELSIVEVVGQYIKAAKKEDLLEFAREQHSGSEKKNDENYDSRRPAFFATRIGSKELLKSRKSKRKKFALDIVSLFDATVELFLLYEQERDCHARLVRRMNGSNGAKKEESSLLSSKYGAVHLLRLFVKLPEILSRYGMPITNDRDGEREGEKAQTRQAQDEDILSSRDKSDDFAGFLSELIVYLQQHIDKSFKLNYEAAAVADG